MNAEQKCVKIVVVFMCVFLNTSSLCLDQRDGFYDKQGLHRIPEMDSLPPMLDSGFQSKIPDAPDSNMPPKFPDFVMDPNMVPSQVDTEYDPDETGIPDTNMPPLEFDPSGRRFPWIPRPDMAPPAFGSHVHPHYHRPWHDMHDRGPPEHRPPVKIKYPDAPQDLRVFPLPLHESDHKLQFNVSWASPVGIQPLDYSLEVISETATEDCAMSICLEYNIPKDALSSLIPKVLDHISGNCAFNPGCSYLVRLTANPWDGRTVAETRIDLDECTAGVCSCAHSSRLPAPIVTADTVHIKGDKFANVSWTLPTPQYPQRLPKGLEKKSYIVRTANNVSQSGEFCGPSCVYTPPDEDLPKTKALTDSLEIPHPQCRYSPQLTSLGKQMVSDAHPAPWFYNIMETVVEADNAVTDGDTKKWHLLRLDKSGGERSDERGGERTRRQTLNVKLLARVNLIDERGCIGPAGNATAYDPDEVAESSVIIYVVWALLGGACVCIMMVILVAGVRAMKKALIALRPAPADVLEPLRNRSAWLPLHLRP